MLTPLFFVIGVGCFSPVEDGKAFSELANMPAMQAAVRVEPVPVSVFPLPASQQVDGEGEVKRMQCLWESDRLQLAALGQKSVPEVSLTDCGQESVSALGVAPENRAIRDKVIALSSDEYPLSDMAGSIATYDSHIAGLIVGIAKKESNWGKRTPKLRGEECFNYWGYRGQGNRGLTEDGYGCFEKPADAVHTIGRRLIELSQTRGATSPERMIAWKCGSSCATHSPESVRKWVSDVNLYYQQFAGAF